MPVEGKVSERLQPVHDLEPGGRVDLFTVPARVRVEQQEVECDVQVWWAWEPGVRVSGVAEGLGVKLVTEVHGYSMEQGGSVTVQIPSVGEIRVDVRQSHVSSATRTWRFQATVNADVGDTAAELTRVDFQVVNFPPWTQSSSDRRSDDRNWRLRLEADGWRIVLDQMLGAHDREKILKMDRGGAVMHAGRLERSSGTPFSWEQAQELCHGLTVLLTFAGGDRATVLLPVGYDADGAPVVHDWRDLRRESYRGRHRWCGALHAGAIVDVWRQFLDLWNDPESRAVVQVAVELYVEAQHGDNLETRTVHAQDALELLAWHWLVERLQFDSDRIDRKDADWRIRKMLTELDIPIHVPDTMPVARRQWEGRDGPKAISELRNAVIHPTDLAGLLAIPSDAKEQVLRLAMWYADLALLRLLDYQGRHLNRAGELPIFNGRGEAVPWAGH